MSYFAVLRGLLHSRPRFLECQRGNSTKLFEMSQVSSRCAFLLPPGRGSDATVPTSAFLLFSRGGMGMVFLGLEVPSTDIQAEAIWA